MNMFRALILGMTLLMITLTAAQLGSSEQIKNVLGLTKTPKPLSTLQEEDGVKESNIDVPLSLGGGQSDQEESPGYSEESGIPPRFVLDEPIPDYSSGSGRVSQLDPSAQGNISGASAPIQPDYKPVPPTAQECKTVAEPYVKELFELKTRAFNQMKEVERKAVMEFAGATLDKRVQALASMSEKYLPQVTQLVTEADGECNKIIQRMTAALAAIGADNTLAKEAKAAYDKEKSEKIQYYMKLITNPTSSTVYPKEAVPKPESKPESSNSNSNETRISSVPLNEEEEGSGL